MYSIDYRHIAINLYSLLNSLRKTAALLRVSYSSIHRWINSPERRIYPQRKKEKSDIIAVCLNYLIEHDPFSSLRSVQMHIASQLHCTVSLQLIRSILKSKGFTKKKARLHGRPSRSDQITTQFVEKRDTFVQNSHPFVSLDETSFGRHGAITKGYSKRGQPLYIKKQNNRLTTTSVLAAVSRDGRLQLSKRYGSFDRNSFLEALKLFSFPKGTVLLLDNVAFHHSKIVKEYCQEQCIYLLYVPAYSPWFNPIEGVFSIVKRHFYIHGSIEEAFHKVTSRHTNAFFDKSFSLKSSPELKEV